MDRSACVEKARADHSRARGGRQGGITNELGAGICCHASEFKESHRKYSHGYAGAQDETLSNIWWTRMASPA